MGDWNAKVGSDPVPGVIGRYGLGDQNERGQRLQQFGLENRLVISNTSFNKVQEEPTLGRALRTCSETK